LKTVTLKDGGKVLIRKEGLKKDAYFGRWEMSCRINDGFDY
jgi:hypothetical protein